MIKHGALIAAAGLALLVGCGGAAPSPAGPQSNGTAEAPAMLSAETPEPASTDAAPAEPTAEPTTPAEPPPTAAPVASTPLPEGATILIIGDSFANSLGLGLKRKQKELGVKFIMKGEKATFIPEWASVKDVAGLLTYWKPDLVVIALGGNELSIKQPEQRTSRVVKLVQKIGDHPCVWVAPSLWPGQTDNGLLGIIKDNASPCVYYDSNELAPELPRGGDGIHPDGKGQDLWAEALLSWLKEQRDPDAEGFAWRK